MNEVRGFKVFNPDWTCRGFQYEVGEIFEEDVEPSCCDRGFHFCENAADCFNYYSFNPDNKVAEVIAYGDIVRGDDKCCTNKIKIVREIPWQELLTIVNTETPGTETPGTETPVTGTNLLSILVVLTQKNQQSCCLINHLNGHTEIG